MKLQNERDTTMLTLNWPWWLLFTVLGVEFWPVALGLGVGLLVLAVFGRGWIRWLALVGVLPCLAATAIAAWWGMEARQREREAAAFEAKVNQVLDSDQVLNGIALPAGTAVQWQDVDHRQLGMASPPDPILLFSLRITWLRRAADGQGWDLQLTAPEVVEGWTCATVGVHVSAAGRLRSCQLAAGRDWRGWPIPAGTFLDLATAGKVGVTLPAGATMAAPEIGHGLTATGSFSFNADGSLDRFYFEPEDPLVVAGRRLWNTVQWSYHPATDGQGRRRRAVTVRGTLVSTEGDAGGDIVIRLADGQVSAAE